MHLKFSYSWLWGDASEPPFVPEQVVAGGLLRGDYTIKLLRKT